MTGSVFQLVLADEVLSMGRQIIRGISLQDLPDALEEIHKLGPGGNHSQTMFSKERSQDFWQPRFMERRSYKAWREDGCKRMRDRIQEYILHLLQERASRRDELSAQVRDSIQDILQRAEVNKAQKT